MHNLKDLNIEKELLPVFDYSLNTFAKRKIGEILNRPLQSTEAIMQRQNIFKGFTANQRVLKDYSYTVLYLNEVHFFLTNEKIEDLSQKKLKYRLFASKQEKIRYISRFNQLILFFHRLESRYFTRLIINEFPEAYRSNIKQILTFFSNFELYKYEYIVREKRLKDTHIIALTEKINELRSNGSVLSFWENLFQFEAYLSIHTAILRNNFTFPSFTEKQISLTEFYHPLIKNAVKNNFETSSNVIVLNGPNMSGKSTFLKAVGLCVYFGHLGIGVPATSGAIPFFTNFSIEINRRDDILNGYSHFMTEIMNLKNVVENASNGNQCFAIFDELFSGTNVEDAFEICKTTINGLSTYKNSLFLISTHIQELKNVSNADISNYYIDCELIHNKPTFTYKLKKGWSDIKVGRILFEKEGLNELLK
ncbi:MutS-related protein [Kordia sp.]|uniref:MutS-related protein n=1 Tax=Kordia sp. TaxID=1965332 RepID=UPI003D29D8E3